MTNEWIPWTGGECPVEPSTKVDLLMKNVFREEILEDEVAGKWVWQHGNLAWIAAYRIRAH